MPATAAPAVSSTVGLKNMVLAPLTSDTEAGVTYDTIQKVAGAIEASVTDSGGCATGCNPVARTSREAVRGSGW